MWTDAPPRRRDLVREFEASDGRVTLPLPEAKLLQRRSAELQDALAVGKLPAVRAAGRRMLEELADFYEVPAPSLRVLGVRPHQTRHGRLSYELFGDYDLESGLIRAWMRTAVQGKVTSHRGFLNTLLHELCHHLDVRAFGWKSTPHTRGFFARVDDLYHLALATPEDERRPLVWIPQGSSFRIDWQKVRAR